MRTERPEILPDVGAQIVEAFQKDVKLRPALSNWASRIGHPCTRHLVHARLDWEKKPLHDGRREILFNYGKMIERHIARQYLEKAGYTIVEHDRPVQNESSGLLKRVKLHGYLDFIVRDPNGWEFPVEVKGVQPWTWEKATTIEDLLFAKHVWTRQYPGQLMVYLLGRDYEIGMFLMINKANGLPRAIWVEQDYTYAEELIQKAETVEKHVTAGTYPDRIEYDESVCGSCDFAHVCLPDTLRTEVDVLTDPDLIAELEERESLKDAKRRYDEVDKAVKERLQGIPKAAVGDFAIFGKTVERKSYTVEAGSYWKTDIKRLGPPK